MDPGPAGQLHVRARLRNHRAGWVWQGGIGNSGILAKSGGKCHHRSNTHSGWEKQWFQVSSLQELKFRQFGPYFGPPFRPVVEVSVHVSMAALEKDAQILQQSLWDGSLRWSTWETGGGQSIQEPCSFPSSGRPSLVSSVKFSGKQRADDTSRWCQTTSPKQRQVIVSGTS